MRERREEERGVEKTGEISYLTSSLLDSPGLTSCRELVSLFREHQKSSLGQTVSGTNKIERSGDQEISPRWLSCWDPSSGERLQRCVNISHGRVAWPSSVNDIGRARGRVLPSSHGEEHGRYLKKCVEG